MTLDWPSVSRGMWAVVDSGLGSMSELEHEWSLDDYAEACEYLEHKHQQQAKLAEDAKGRARGGR